MEIESNQIIFLCGNWSKSIYILFILEAGGGSTTIIVKKFINQIYLDICDEKNREQMENKPDAFTVIRVDMVVYIYSNL